MKFRALALSGGRLIIKLLSDYRNVVKRVGKSRSGFQVPVLFSRGLSERILEPISICCRGGEGQGRRSGFPFPAGPSASRNQAPAAGSYRGKKGSTCRFFGFPEWTRHLPQVPIARGHSPPVAFQLRICNRASSVETAFPFADEPAPKGPAVWGGKPEVPRS